MKRTMVSTFYAHDNDYLAPPQVPGQAI